MADPSPEGLEIVELLKACDRGEITRRQLLESLPFDIDVEAELAEG